MLVLRRKAGEAIVLNGMITIHVLAVEGERVKLGISAPPEVVIVRSELLEGQGQPGAPASAANPAAPPYAQQPARREPQRGFREPGAPDASDPHGDPTRHTSPGQSGQVRYSARARTGDDRIAPAGYGTGPLSHL